MYLNEKLNTKNGFFMVEMGGLQIFYWFSTHQVGA